MASNERQRTTHSWYDVANGCVRVERSLAKYVNLLTPGIAGLKRWTLQRADVTPTLEVEEHLKLIASNAAACE